jgi:hypothetical protein
MHKNLRKRYLTVGDIADLCTWSPQYVLRDLKRGALRDIAVPCVHGLKRYKHHRVLDTQEVREFCQLVRETPLGPNGQRRHEILMKRETEERIKQLPVRPGTIEIDRPLPRSTRTPTTRRFTPSPIFLGDEGDDLA